MKYLKIYEDLNQYKPAEFKRRDYLFQEYSHSKIDPSKKLIIKSWMICPICKEKIGKIGNGEIRICPKCNTRMQVRGTGIYISNIEPVYVSHRSKEEEVVEYTEDYTKEKLTYSDYEGGNQMKCPLCDEILDSIEHGKTEICPVCNLKMTRLANRLVCEIKNKNLELYSSEIY